MTVVPAVTSAAKEVQPASSRQSSKQSEPQPLDADTVPELATAVNVPELATTVPGVPDKYFKRERRVSYSSESTSADNSLKSLVAFPKSDVERARLEAFIFESENILFANLSPAKISMIVNAMFKKDFPSDAEIITQGALDADYFYILDEGHCDIFVKRTGGPEEKVKDIMPGNSFGELALLYMCPRAASVRTTCKSVLWALARDQFRSLVVGAAQKEKSRYETFLSGIEVLSALNQYERMTLADALEVETYEEGEDAIEQGDDADHLFILESGAAQAILEVDGEEVVLKEYRTPGDVFGELALLQETKRNATVRCTEETTCLKIEREVFEGLLGPIHDILRRNAELYTKYGDQLSKLPARRYSAVRFTGSELGALQSFVPDELPSPKALPPKITRRTSVALEVAATETGREMTLRLRSCARQLLSVLYSRAAAEMLRQMMASPAYREQFPVDTSYDNVSAKKRASKRKTAENIPDIIQEC